ncbi:hypothetical protein HGA34_01590 [Candidatus Falkowbacteria bacterium]|nr:hypothetical protein [Candidatus Falkowbacteria bacterium]
MKRLISSTLVALAITLSSTLAFAGVTQTCVDGDSIRVPARAMVGLNMSATIYAACDENQWGAGDMTGYELVKDSAGDYVIAKSKIADGRFHPVNVTSGKVLWSKTHAVKGLTVDRSEGGSNLKADAACK